MHNNLEVIMRPKVGHIPLGASRLGEPHYNPHPPADGGVYPSMGWANPSAPPISKSEFVWI